MYQKNTSKWGKHWDFILADVIGIELAYGLVFLLLDVKNSLFRPMGNMYELEAFILLLMDLAIVLFSEPYKNILRRSARREFAKTAQHVAFVYIMNLIVLYFLHIAHPFSRLLMGWSSVFSLAFCYGLRCLLKQSIHSRANSNTPKRSMIIITTERHMADTTDNICEKTFLAYEIPAIFLIDRPRNGEENYHGIPVFGNEENPVDYITHRWCDEAYINIDKDDHLSGDITNRLLDMGITLHEALDETSGEYVIERFGDERVLTTSMKMVSGRMMIAKRFFDILGGLIGCAITGIIYLIIAPQIRRASPGPVFFSQTRIGRNGKPFKMYKFRSMYLDAEERKKELLSQNKSEDGMIFKMDDDPRIIGSEIKDKNGRPNGIGNKIRRTSLDEFPQFWNVLKGDMSLVGTRPPTVDEWDKYSTDQRLRMSIKPGITGLWQVSGRSEITDFDEIVKLDAEYIRNMSIGQDLKILIKTVKVVVTHEGAE